MRSQVERTKGMQASFALNFDDINEKAKLLGKAKSNSKVESKTPKCEECRPFVQSKLKAKLVMSRIS